MNGYPQTSCYKLNKKNTTAEEAQKNCRHMSPMIGLPVNLASINVGFLYYSIRRHKTTINPFLLLG